MSLSSCGAGPWARCCRSTGRGRRVCVSRGSRRSSLGKAAAATGSGAVNPSPVSSRKGSGEAPGSSCRLTSRGRLRVRRLRRADALSLGSGGSPASAFLCRHSAPLRSTARFLLGISHPCFPGDHGKNKGEITGGPWIGVEPGSEPWRCSIVSFLTR